MERIYYSRQNYNQLKRKQYEAYLRMQNRYYLNRKKYYEEYLKRQKRYYLNRKKHYEEYLKRQKRYYSNRKKYYEEYLRRLDRYYLNRKKNCEVYLKMQNRNYLYKKNYGYFIDYTEEDNLRYEKHNSKQYDYLEDEKYPSIKAQSNMESIQLSYDEMIDEKTEEIIEDIEEEITGEVLGEKDGEVLEEIGEEIIEESRKNNILDEVLYVKFPVVLAETNVTITVEDTIIFNKEVMELKEIKKNVFLTKTNLIPYSSITGNKDSGILFVKGFISKKIEYKIMEYNAFEESNVHGSIRYCTVEVPFNFTTRVTFIRQPIFIESNHTSELKFIGDIPNDLDLNIEYDSFEKGFVFTEVFNEKPFVEIVKATFIEVDSNDNSILSNDVTTEQICTRVKEKIVLSLILRVLQNQQLRIEKE
ncbi:hypothetical protein R0131_14635 [Clostridium sp. AL.422]|uniref:CsxC family protein n=1 Tax=Clostridium TaxID=1485 RepID=UPI00293DECE8|nr:MULTISPECIES: hypothetical protein [unclassified Clostridium]MDV4152063.1 hypothetical protein [Clostridium sp. AL.422]